VLKKKTDFKKTILSPGHQATVLFFFNLYGTKAHHLKKITTVAESFGFEQQPALFHDFSRRGEIL
jgi:hypothetical protein